MKQKALLFLNNPLIKKSIKVMFIRFLGVFFLFSVTLFITNNFENSLVGQYDVSRSFLFIVGSICLLGLNQSIIYYSGFLKANDSISSIKRLYFKMLLIIFCTSTFLFFIYLLIPKATINNFYEKEVYNIIFKTVCIVFFYTLTMLNVELYRAINKIETSEIFRNVYRHVFFLIALYIISINELDNFIVEIFLANFIFLGIISTFFIFFSFKKIKKSCRNIDIPYKEIIYRSYPMSLSIIGFVAMQSIDIILIGKFMDYKEVAYYSVAVKLTMIVALVLSSVNSVYAPKISELFNLKNFNVLEENIKKATRLIFLLTMPVIIFFLFFSNIILNLFGEGYQYANNALQILLIGQIINALSGSVGMYMNMTGDQKVYQKIILSSLLINIVLNWLLIPKYELVGASIATTISTIYWNVISVYFLYYKRQIKTFLH
ncbi:MAG: MATE family efflux transporter [Flavobacteriales bacterium]